MRIRLGHCQYYKTWICGVGDQDIDCHAGSKLDALKAMRRRLLDGVAQIDALIPPELDRMRAEVEALTKQLNDAGE